MDGVDSDLDSSKRVSRSSGGACSLEDWAMVIVFPSNTAGSEAGRSRGRRRSGRAPGGRRGRCDDDLRPREVTAALELSPGPAILSLLDKLVDESPIVGRPFSCIPRENVPGRRLHGLNQNPCACER